MRSSLAWKFLELIENSAFALSDIFTIFTLPYGTSFNKMYNVLMQKDLSRRSIVEELRQTFQEKRKLYDLLYKLKKDGLVETTVSHGKKILKITDNGKNKLAKLRVASKNKLPIPHYSNETETEMKIIAFDIPEKEKFKRDWLRKILTLLKFQMIQKSVWLGNSKISEELILDFDRLKLLPHLAIFKVTKTGTLENMINTISTNSRSRVSRD